MIRPLPFLPSFARDPDGRSFKLEKSNQDSAFLCDGRIDFFQGGETLKDGKIIDYDFVDAVSKRRRERTRSEGVPFHTVDLVLMRPDSYMNQSGGPPGQTPRCCQNAKK